MMNKECSNVGHQLVRMIVAKAVVAIIAVVDFKSNSNNTRVCNLPCCLLLSVRRVTVRRATVHAMA